MAYLAAAKFPNTNVKENCPVLGLMSEEMHIARLNPQVPPMDLRRW